MVSFNYTIAQFPEDVASATEDDLDYRLFLGDVGLEAEGVKFDASWGWIPVLNFATMVLLALRELAEGDGATADVELTESDDAFHFLRHRDAVEISTSFADGRASVPYGDFASAVISLARRVFDEVATRYPSLLANPVFVQRLELLASFRETA